MLFTFLARSSLSLPLQFCSHDLPDNALVLEAILSTDDCNVEIVDSGAAAFSFMEASTNLPDL